MDITVITEIVPAEYNGYEGIAAIPDIDPADSVLCSDLYDALKKSLIRGQGVLKGAVVTGDQRVLKDAKRSLSILELLGIGRHGKKALADMNTVFIVEGDTAVPYYERCEEYASPLWKIGVHGGIKALSEKTLRETDVDSWFLFPDYEGLSSRKLMADHV